MKYKITFKNNLRVLTSTFIFHIAYAIIIYALYKLDNDQSGFVVIFGIGYGISIIPTIFLHFEYYIRNKNDEVQIDIAQKAIIINETKRIFYRDIEKIILFMPPVWHRKSSLRIFPFEDYRYAKIQMKDGGTFIFSCLMGFDVDKIMSSISGVEIGKEIRLVATPLID